MAISDGVNDTIQLYSNLVFVVFRRKLYKRARNKSWITFLELK